MSNANDVDPYEPPCIEDRSDLAGLLVIVGSGNIDAPPI